jgi:hypothetical protein
MGSAGLWKWQYSVDSASPTVAPVTGATASVSAPITFPSAAVRRVCAVAIDLAGNSSQESCLFAVAYDPAAGFVTGGGWFNSPAGAYTANPALTGKANFGFVSRYQPGAHVPSGQTEFQFKAAGLEFKSTAYEWLVVAGSRAQFKGTGLVNGMGNFSFLLTAIDGRIQGDGLDKLRIKIQDKTSGNVIYDNHISVADNANPSTLVQGGSIMIHR